MKYFIIISISLSVFFLFVLLLDAIFVSWKFEKVKLRNKTYNIKLFSILWWFIKTIQIAFHYVAFMIGMYCLMLIV